MLSRRFCAMGCLAVFSLLILQCCEIGLADQFSQFDTKGGEALTAEVLKKKLYAKTGPEEAFCDRVILKRDQGVLPNKILYTAYRYAVEKETARRFIYFQKSLEKLCKDAKIDISTVSTEEQKGNWFTLTKAQTKTQKSTTATKTNPFSSFFKVFRR